MMPSDYHVVRYGDIEVCWLPQLDGGGRDFGQDYLSVVRNLFGPIGRVFEFCAGSGFIGFSLLAHGLCDSLALADVNPHAVRALRETVRRNCLGDRVEVYHSDGLANIPDSERWNLVVGNPPHFGKPFYRYRKSLITDDPQWLLHWNFYREVARFLADGGSVLLQENSKGSSPDDFLPMLQEGGLDHVRTLWYSANGESCFYYLWAKKSLNGLILESAAPAVHDIQLTQPASARTIQEAGVFQLRLHNRLNRVIRPRLISDLWKDELDSMQPLGSRSLPLMAFRAGTYVIDDSASLGEGDRLATIVVAAREQ